MTEQHPAGWYSQSDGSQRYYDGTRWTDQIVPPGQSLGNGAQYPPSPDAHTGASSKKPWFTKKRVLIPAAAVVMLAGYSALQGGDGSDSAVPVTTSVPSSAQASSEAPSPSAQSPEAVAEVATEIAPEPSPTSENVAEPAEDSGFTVSQTQAVRQAESYLDFAAFSRSGLIKQLEFEGFSNADSTFAVDNITVDWMEQSVLKAADYVSYSAFSQSGLVAQLEFEGFSAEEAAHGVEKIEVDWMEQAALKAKDYLEYSGFSRASLIEQLEFEGFTSEQAAHGADAAGL